MVPVPARNGRVGWLPGIRTALEGRGASVAAIVAVSGAGLCGYLQAAPNVLLVLVIAVSVLIEFSRRVDTGIPLMQTAAFIACLQWLVGPTLAYNTDLMIGRYVMYVAESNYFSFALPATAAFVAGALAGGASIRQRDVLAQTDRSQFVTIGLVLNAISFVADSLFREGGLAFFFHLLSQLRYVGIIYFVLSGHPWRWAIAALAFLPLVLRSAESTMFHDLILWGMLIFFYWFASRSRSLGMKAAILIAGCLSIFTIQMVKQTYRGQATAGEDASYLEGAADLWIDGNVSQDGLALALVRLNQGWIISAVLANVPESEPFAQGETIKDAVLASFVPRVLWADKKSAGGQENFRRFTGLPIEEGTSMGISPLGEAYANFGWHGGIAAMLVYGLVFSFAFAAAARHSLKYPTFVLWIPLIFYQAIKAETELVVVLNQVIKGGIVAIAVYHLIRYWTQKERSSRARWVGRSQPPPKNVGKSPV